MFLKTLFSNTLSLCSPLNAEGESFMPTENNRKKCRSVCLIFKSLDSKCKNTRLWTNGRKHSPNLFHFQYFMQAILVCWCHPKYLNFCRALKGYATFVLQLHPAFCLWKMNIRLAIINNIKKKELYSSSV
jgi:hypothetical protein